MLSDFGYLTTVRVSTRGFGERAFMIDWREKAGPATLLSFLQQAEIKGVEAEVTLTCLDRNLKPMEIPGGASFGINIGLTESGTLDPDTDAPVYIHFVLHADIYAPVSAAKYDDNALLAALNGPRLAGVLERIETDVPAELLEIEYEHYARGSVGPRGFIAPKGTTPEA